jgi:GNAT superfamily N-acetyltransferase
MFFQPKMRLFRATEDDVPRIMDCAREFCALLGQKLNEAHYETVWRLKLRGDLGAIFLLEDDGDIVGGIGAIKAQDMLSADWYAIEAFWYVKPEHRGGLWSVRLMKRFEEWGFGEARCAEVAMVHMEQSMPAQLKAFYERSGYVLDETVYRKRIGGNLCQS